MRKIILLIVTFICVISIYSPALAASPYQGEKVIQVYYAGSAGGVKTALSLALNIKIVSDPIPADVFVLNGSVPNAQLIAQKVEAGVGLLLILGPNVKAQDIQPLLATGVTLEHRENPLSLIASQDTQESLCQDIVWNSAPQIRERFF